MAKGRARAARKPRGPASELRVAESGELPVAELVKMASPYNPRKISDADFAALRRSVRFYGFVEPVVINRRTGHIVGGHQRVQAAAAEGFEVLPTMTVDLDDPTERQLNLALNRIAGEFDDAKLREVLAELDAGGADLSLTGFNDDELGKILGADESEDGEGPALGALEYRVVIECHDETEQVELIERFEKEGLSCRALIS